MTISMETPAWLDRASWPWSPRAFVIDGARLHYVDEGAGAPVVLVHGTPTWSFEWRHVVAGLRGAARVIAVDHLGFGLSDRPHGAGYRPEDHAARFRRFIDEVCPSGPLTLVVHDFGGPIALDWALDHPDRLAHLVVVNSWMWPFDDDAAMRRSAQDRRRPARPLAVPLGQRLAAPDRAGRLRRPPPAPAIRSEYCRCSLTRIRATWVLFALARSLLGSGAFFSRLWQRRDRLAGVDVPRLGHPRPGLLDSDARPPGNGSALRPGPHGWAGHWPRRGGGGRVSAGRRVGRRGPPTRS
ncbi:MAG: alpha/beta fold hydrolase [Vicinamibacterales bacterium]